MGEKHSPTDVGAIRQKIDSGKIKVKAQKNMAKKNPNKEHSVRGQNGKISDHDILAWLKRQDGQVTSTQLRDGLGFTSRTQARRVLRRLAKAKKVKIESRKLLDKRNIYTFGVAYCIAT